LEPAEKNLSHRFEFIGNSGVVGIPRVGIFESNIKAMPKNTSLLLGDYFDNFIKKQVNSGKFSSASEVMRAALRLFEFEESKKTQLQKELKKGEESGFVKRFSREKFLREIHSKNVKK
jgi:antitoxin ParD1/3/4